MLSRIFWAGIAGIAIIAGMAWQGGGILSWDDEDPIVSVKSDRSIDERVDRAIETGIGKMEVLGSDGEKIDVPAETKRELAEAVARLVKAETDFALVKIRDGSASDLKAAEERRSEARAEVDRLKGEIERLDRADNKDGDVLAQEIRQQVREEVRAEVRDAVRN